MHHKATLLIIHLCSLLHTITSFIKSRNACYNVLFSDNSGSNAVTSEVPYDSILELNFLEASSYCTIINYIIIWKLKTPFKINK
jgi:hypothetical protein